MHELDEQVAGVQYPFASGLGQESSLELSGDVDGQVLNGLLRPRNFFHLTGIVTGADLSARP